MTLRSPRPGPVLVDVQATQSASHRDRGVARYTAELAAALWRRIRPLVHSFLLNPDLAPPGSVEALVASGRLVDSDRRRRSRRAAPCTSARRSSSRFRSAGCGRRGVARHAAGRDAVRPDPRDLRRALPRRSRVCGAATGRGSSSCAPPTSCSRSPRPLRRRGRAPARAGGPDRRGGPRRGRELTRRRPGRRSAGGARAAVPGLEERFVLYTAGMDDRKNFHGLCSARGPAAGAGARRLAARDGVQHGRPDAQSPRAPRSRGRHRDAAAAARASCPTRCCACSTSRPICSCSRRSTRDTGCPIAEALACGARTIGSSTSSVAELLVPEAQFDPGRRRRDGERDRARSPTTRRAHCSTTRRATVARVGTRSPIAGRGLRAGARASAPAGAAPSAGRGRHAAPARGERRRRLQLPLARGAARALRRARVRRRLPARRSRSRPSRRARRRRGASVQPGRPGTSAAATTASSTASATASSTRALGAAAAALGRRARARGAAHRSLRAERRRAGRGAGSGLRGLPDRMYDGLDAGTGGPGGSRPTRQSGSACSWRPRSSRSPTGSS